MIFSSVIHVGLVSRRLVKAQVRTKAYFPGDSGLACKFITLTTKTLLLAFLSVYYLIASNYKLDMYVSQIFLLYILLDAQLSKWALVFLYYYSSQKLWVNKHYYYYHTSVLLYCRFDCIITDECIHKGPFTHLYFMFVSKSYNVSKCLLYWYDCSTATMWVWLILILPLYCLAALLTLYTHTINV